MNNLANSKSWMKRSLTIALLFVLSSAYMFAQQVKGVVKDANGEPLIGVNIVEKGTTNGTISRADGSYSLNVAKGKTLVFSYIGYKAKEAVVNGGSVNVTLKEDSKLLTEQVVIGYGTMQRKDVTSSITTVKAEDLNRGVFTDPAQMLQGKVPGLVVTSTGDPNGSPSITLRGASSLRTGEAMSPYYVIDGIPGVDISMVAADDIESIDVLRDATATAIYGSKAANGVIIITTKGGKKGKTHVTYNGYVAVDRILNTLEMASADDIRSYVKANDIDYAYDEGGNVDWQKEVLRTGISHNHNVSINGGSDKTTYMASINYKNNQGVVRGTGMNRLNARTLLTTKILKDHLQISAGVNAMYGRGYGVPMNNEGRSVLDAMNYANPTSPIYYNETDEKNGHVGQWHFAKGSDAYNPVSMINEDSSEFMWKRMQYIGKATLKIIEGLTWSANYQYGNNQRTSSSYDSHATQLKIGEGVTAKVGETMNGVAKRSTYFGSESTFETYGNFDKTFNDVHKLALMAGYSWEERRSNDGFGLQVYNFHDDQLKWNQLTYAGEIDGMNAVESGTKQTIRNISFYGRASYSYASRYMIQASIRRDGSSVFGDGHQWGTFPSVSAAWNIAEEPFMKNQEVLSNLKLRAGYGISGNALGFGAYTAVATYGATGTYNVYNGSSYVVLGATKLANPDLKWETTGMLNVGLDYAFLGGRINGSIEFYNKKTKDLIWDYPVSSYIYPFSSISTNVGEITNRGIEFTINADVIQNRHFRWNTSLNLSHNKNRVDKLSNETYKVDTFDQGDPMVAGVSANGFTQRIIEGQPLGTFYTYQFAGYDKDGISTYYERDADGNLTGTTTKDPAYKDRTITGCAQPKLNVGWNNTLTYKNWNLNLFFTGVFGNKIYNGLRAHYTAPDFFAGGKNVLKEFITDRPYTDTSSNIPSDKFIESGDYVRLQSASLSYTFKNCFNGWIDDLTIYGTANNVFTITKYKGLDPEVNLGGIDPGVDYRWSTYPHTRTFMLGIKVNFSAGDDKRAEQVVYQPQIVEKEVVKEVPVEKQVVKNVDKLVPDTHVVTFAVGSASIEDKSELDRIPAGSSVEVVAYASPEGNADANLALSQRRADAVADYLKSKGINVTRVSAKGADTEHSNRIAIVTVK